MDLSELKQMQDELLQSKHYSTIGETAAMVGHDLRNPVQVIIGATYTLKTLSETLDEEGKMMTQVIEENIRRPDKIITNLVEYSCEPYLDLSTTNPKGIIEASLAQLRIPENIHVDIQASTTPTIEVDIEKIRRACTNIVRNAIDAMPNGDKLTITTRQCNDVIELCFTDTGSGISEKILPKIWNPLFTTKAQGMGYGLAIAKRFVEKRGGTVSVKTKLGTGSTFTISLPTKPTRLQNPRPLTDQ